MTRIAVLDYGMGNMHSVSRALATTGAEVAVTADGAEALQADALVIPGVGHFGACMRALRADGLDTVAKDFVGTGRPVFAVCVGMQVLFEGSDEDADPGLGVFPGVSRRLSGDVTVPHMGWNTVRWVGTHPYVAGIPDDSFFYFVHSYAPEVDPGLTLGEAVHGRPFSAAVARDNVFATQFHPEKSGDAGLRVYANFVEALS